MKIYILILSCIVVAACRKPDATLPTDATLRTESTESTKFGGEKVHFQKTYRGDQLILMVTHYSNVTTRTFFLHGGAICVESDNDGDGLFETLSLSGETPGDIQKFIRKPDGTPEPISAEEYLKWKETILGQRKPNPESSNKSMDCTSQ